MGLVCGLDDIAILPPRADVFETDLSGRQCRECSILCSFLVA
jgi:hypothetical protein